MEWFYPLLVKASPILLKSAAVSLGVGLIGGWTYTFVPYAFDFVGIYEARNETGRLDKILEKTINAIDKKSGKKLDLIDILNDVNISPEETVFFGNQATQLDADVEKLETKKQRLVHLIDTNEEKVEALIEKQKENLNARAETVKKNRLAVQLGLFAGSLALFYFFGVPINLNEVAEKAKA